MRKGSYWSKNMNQIIRHLAIPARLRKDEESVVLSIVHHLHAAYLSRAVPQVSAYGLARNEIHVSSWTLTWTSS